MAISFSSPVTSRDARARGAGVTAVLGPTNTGKTHLAIERMLAHSSGIIGLPLRLLAREVYNKVADRMGPESVALVTGEEKIKPPNPRYWVSTVEAMPRDLDVAFLAIDEVQLAADFERGHVFTDRMLNRRGRDETLVLGAQTVRPMVERLLPGAHVLTRPRLSQLTFAGEKKITRLPRRSAVVAFSAEEVYAIAELIRRQRGGAAVVLGALSPRTRNAQVALYQSGDVDYLVATDAIGMGLNLDVDHVAFASDRKFDGYQFRRLNPAELAQIAGRAGRATRDGTFGTTGRCPAFETELVQALESHSFEPIKLLQWRNTTLDFFSIGALLASLAETPKEIGLTRAPVAEDILVLEHAAREDEVRTLAQTPDAVERLWEVCQVPDYRRISPATHAELVITLFGFLMRESAIPTDWFARQVDQADNPEGDIDTLSNRIAHIRTWTFAANQPDWLEDPAHWQEVTRAVEDKLSDALHERLTDRFVDRRTSALMRRLRENAGLDAEISKSGDVVVAGHRIGRLDGFMFTPDASAAGSEAKTLAGAAQKVLAGEIDARASRLSQAPDEQFVLATDGIIRWMGQPVGKLIAGEEVLKPRVRIIADERLTGSPRDIVQARLDLWLKKHIEKFLGPLFQLAAAEDITGIARGVAFQLAETLGVIERQKVADEVKGLDQPTRATLRKHGVRFGAHHIYLPPLIKPAARVLAVQLWVLKHEGPETKGVESVEQLAASGRTSVVADKETAKVLYRTAGYRVCGERAVRVDILERLADIIRSALTWRPNSPGQKPLAAFEGGGFTVTPAMTSLLGCSGEEFASILRSLGYRMEMRPKPAAAPAAAPVAESAAQPESPAQPAAPAEAPTKTAAAEESSTEMSTLPSEWQAAAEAEPGEIAPMMAQASESMTTEQEPIEAPESVTADEVAAEASEPAAIEETPAVAESRSAQEPAVEPALPLYAPEATDVPTVADTTATPAESPPEATIDAVSTDEAAASAAAAVAPADATAPAAELIEVWRPGRTGAHRQHQRRPRDGAGRGERGRRPRPGQPTAEGAVAAAADAAAGSTGAEPAPSGGEDQSAGRHRRRREFRAGDQDRKRPERDREDRRPRPHRPEPRADRGAHARPETAEHGSRPPRRDRPERGGRGDRPDRDPELRAKYIKGRGGDDRRDKLPDPNSPFAKLAALKAQLEADAKERR
jgi:ATP-dependent RNA helicase SUPV3L1/SUV3